MSKATEYGRDLWLMLAPTFDTATSLDGFSGHQDKAHAFAGFIAAIAGTMSAQLGSEGTRAILEATAQALPNTPGPTLRVVKS